MTSGELPLSHLPDTLECLLVRWDPPALRNMIRAVYRYMEAPQSQEEEEQLGEMQDSDKLYCPVPSMHPTLDTSSDNWLAAIYRFAHAHDDVLRTEYWTLWARAILLCAMAMTHGARYLLFSDDIYLLRIRCARSPSLDRRRLFLGELEGLHRDFYASGYEDVEEFVLKCAAVHYTGTADAWALMQGEPEPW